jgi:succinyl-CoA synthetase beta subunit
MKMHEYQTRDVLAQYGIPFPLGRVAYTPDQVRAIARGAGRSVVVKAQILVGGRGKAGGVKVARTPDEAADYSRAILGAEIQGRLVQKVLVCEALPVSREFYLGVVLDRAVKGVSIMASSMGGVDIEEVARSSPEAIAKVSADPLLGLVDSQARELAAAVNLVGEQAKAFREITKALYKAFLECDCTMLEINPLALTESGELVALDSKMEIDDNALYRQPTLAALRDTSEEEPSELEAQRVGVTYVKLDGNVGCIVNGAGLAMATMDSIKQHGGEPANFLDIGGGAHAEQIGAALDIVLRDRNVRAVLINIFGGITRCDVVAQALVDCMEKGGVNVPVVARLVGTNAAEGRQILTGTCVSPATRIHPATTMAEAAALVVALADESSDEEYAGLGGAEA